MGNTINSMESLFERVEDFGKTSFELYKLKTISKTTEVVSTFVSRGSVVIVLSMFLIFVSIGLALWIGDLFGKPYLGFFCVAAFYIVLGGVLYYFLHQYIKKQVSNSIISEVFSK
ncbi:MAG: hypothetical protein COW67_12370 [Flavobacteriales bacterium CG18_big_fil_WC_8_21_14_2_50_32_9]|nr:MAG: hypothetical protein COW67_12370 [Flavobacteriales bacterium CG18_big_fil_WC_8_21_14_2_50_32_9]PJC61751.1 MAG: hypothetical protein CO022_08150 [Flavobacteriales bacterium CG_4_9_14_0_2_um_filter_32_27]